MRLTGYTDYTLRVMMYLAIKYKTGELATIDQIGEAYKISRAHVAKIVYDFGLAGMIATVRGRTGGMRLARAPEDISIGELVRLAERDFAVVACHDSSAEVDCAIFPACNLKRVFRRAMDAFMMELDSITLADSITSHSVAAGVLGLGHHSVIAMPASRRAASAAAPAASSDAPAARPGRVQPKKRGAIPRKPD